MEEVRTGDQGGRVVTVLGVPLIGVSKRLGSGL